MCSIATTAMPTSPMTATPPGWRRLPCLFWAGPRSLSITTTTGGKTCSSPTVMSTPWWTRTTGARLTLSGRCLFHNQKGKKFDLVPAVEGSGLAVVIPARGAAFGDLFNDGRIDVVINNMDSVPTLLRNVDADRHHWVELSLVGGAKEPEGCGWRYGLSNRRWSPAAWRRAQRGQLCLFQRSAGAFRSGRCGQSRCGGDSLAGRPKEKVNLPGVDRIFTVEEGKGVTAETCAQCPPQAGKKN